MDVIEGRANGAGRRVGVVVTRWNELITRELLAGALDELRDAETVVVRVPGAWEVPLAVRTLIETHEPHAVVALGCILQGQTPHAQMLASDVGGALMNLQLETGVPIAWGILTPDTPEQALDRAGLKLGNKGREAALAALEIVDALARLRNGRG